jgi:hypothetical protein
MAEDLEFSRDQADALLAPNLKTFGSDFDSHDVHPESWTDFGKKEEDWLRGLANAATARKAALKRIEIISCPDTCTWGMKEEDGYPWDRMDRIRDESWLEAMAPKPVRKGRLITNYFFPVRTYDTDTDTDTGTDTDG